MQNIPVRTEYRVSVYAGLATRQRLIEAAKWWIDKLTVRLNDSDSARFVEAFVTVVQEQKPDSLGIRGFITDRCLNEIGRRAWLPPSAWPLKAFCTHIDWEKARVVSGYEPGWWCRHGGVCGTIAARRWAAAAERRRERAFAVAYRIHPVMFAIDAARLDLKIEEDVILDSIEGGFDQGLLDIQLGREATTFEDPWANMAASLARTWARLGY
jgi:hypothetical protein